MQNETTKKFLRELIRELVEGGAPYNELKGFVLDVIEQCFLNPEEAMRESGRDLEELEQS